MQLTPAEPLCTKQLKYHQQMMRGLRLWNLNYPVGLDSLPTRVSAAPWGASHQLRETGPPRGPKLSPPTGPPSGAETVTADRALQGAETVEVDKSYRLRDPPGGRKRTMRAPPGGAEPSQALDFNMLLENKAVASRCRARLTTPLAS